MKNREFWITPCGRSEYKKSIAKTHIKHGCSECNGWDDKEVLHVREVLPTDKTYEMGIRDGINKAIVFLLKFNDGQYTQAIARLSNHFNLSPADQKGEKNEG